MTGWIRDFAGPLNPEQQAVADGLTAIVERFALPQLDVAASSSVADAGGFHATFVHRKNPELRVDVYAGGPGGEIVVGYGNEHENFRSQDAVEGLVFPFPSGDHIQATLSLVESLLTGRVELHVWKRPLAIRTRSYWINEDGKPELFLRGGTVGPFFGWSREPEIYRFDFTEPASSTQ